MKEHGVNGKQLAKIAQVSPSAVVKWKRGTRIGTDALARIAMHFNQSLDSLSSTPAPRSASEVSEPLASTPAHPHSRPSTLACRETPPPYSSPAPSNLYASLAASVSELATRLAHVEQLLIQLIARKDRHE